MSPSAESTDQTSSDKIHELRSIFDLPDETLATVFFFCEAVEISDRLTGYNVELVPDPRLLRGLMLVCRRWYDIVGHEPSLWAAIHVSQCSPPLSRLYLERSKQSPLACWIDCVDEETVFDSKWDDGHVGNLIQHSGRIKHMVLRAKTRTYSVFPTSQSGHPWASLLSARFIRHTTLSGDSPIDFPIRTAQNLTSLVLEGLVLGEDSGYTFPNLRHLEIKSSVGWSNSLNSLLGLLASTPRLDNLDLSDTSNATDWVPVPVGMTTNVVPPIQFKRLRSFSCHSSSVNSLILRLPAYLTFPTNCDLSYQFSFETKSTVSDEETRFHTRLAKTLLGLSQAQRQPSYLSIHGSDGHARFTAISNPFVHSFSTTVLSLGLDNLPANGDSPESAPTEYSFDFLKLILERTCDLGFLRNLSLMGWNSNFSLLSLFPSFSNLREVELGDEAAALFFASALFQGCRCGAVLPALQKIQISVATLSRCHHDSCRVFSPTSSAQSSIDALRMLHDALVERYAVVGPLTKLNVVRSPRQCYELEWEERETENLSEPWEEEFAIELKRIAGSQLVLQFEATPHLAPTDGRGSYDALNTTSELAQDKSTFRPSNDAESSNRNPEK